MSLILEGPIITHFDARIHPGFSGCGSGPVAEDTGGGELAAEVRGKSEQSKKICLTPSYPTCEKYCYSLSIN